MLCYVVFVLCIFNILTSTSLRAVLKGKQLLNKVGLWQKAFSGAQDFLQLLLQLWKFGQSPFTPAPSLSSSCVKMRRRIKFDSYSWIIPPALLVSQKIWITSPFTVYHMVIRSTEFLQSFWQYFLLTECSRCNMNTQKPRGPPGPDF